MWPRLLVLAACAALLLQAPIITADADAKTTATTKPATTQATTKPATTQATTKPATTQPTTKPATTQATTKPATTQATTKPATTQPTTKPATTQPTTKPATTQPTTKPETTQPTTKPATTQPTTKPATTQPTTKPATTQPTTKPATTQPTTKPATGHPISSETTKPPTAAPRYVVNTSPNGSACIILETVFYLDSFDANGTDKGSYQFTGLNVTGICEETSSSITLAIPNDPLLPGAELTLQFSLNSQKKQWSLNQAVLAVNGFLVATQRVFGVSAPVGRAFACDNFTFAVTDTVIGTSAFTMRGLRVQALGIENDDFSAEVKDCAPRYAIQDENGTDCLILKASVALETSHIKKIIKEMTKHMDIPHFHIPKEIELPRARIMGECNSTIAEMAMSFEYHSFNMTLELILVFELKDESTWFLSKVGTRLDNGEILFSHHVPAISASIGQSYACEKTSFKLGPKSEIDLEFTDFHVQAFDISSNKLSSEVAHCTHESKAKHHHITAIVIGGGLGLVLLGALLAFLVVRSRNSRRGYMAV